MANKGFIVWDNLMSMRGANASGFPVDASMDTDNILSETPSKFYRSLSNAPSRSSLNASNVALGYLSANAFVLAGHNFGAGDMYRIVVVDDVFTGPALGHSYYKPTGDFGAMMLNTTISFGDIDNEEVIAGSFFGPTNTALPWRAAFSFATPIADPATGANRQAFWIYVRATVVDRTEVSVSLFESGSPKDTNLRTYTIQSTTGQWLYFPFDASDLTNPDGSSIQAVISFDSGGSGYAELRTVILDTDEHIVVTPANDSGWLTYDPFKSTILTFLPLARGKGRSAIWLPSTMIVGQFIIVEFRVANSPPDYDSVLQVAPTPASYIQVGTFVMGEKWTPTTDRGHGPYVGTDELTHKGTNYGGSSFGSRLPVRRTLSWPLGILSKMEGMTVYDRIWRYGILKKYFVCLAPEDEIETTHTGFMASLANAKHVLSTSGAEEGNRSVTLEFIEEL